MSSYLFISISTNSFFIPFCGKRVRNNIFLSLKTDTPTYNLSQQSYIQ